MLAQLMNEIGEVTDSVQKIKRSLEKQQGTVEQANVRLEQIYDVVHKNSATAQQSAADSEELNAQAELLQEMVGNFIVK